MPVRLFTTWISAMTTNSALLARQGPGSLSILANHHLSLPAMSSQKSIATVTQRQANDPTSSISMTPPDPHAPSPSSSSHIGGRRPAKGARRPGCVPSHWSGCEIFGLAVRGLAIVTRIAPRRSLSSSPKHYGVSQTTFWNLVFAFCGWMMDAYLTPPWGFNLYSFFISSLAFGMGLEKNRVLLCLFSIGTLPPCSGVLVPTAAITSLTQR